MVSVHQTPDRKEIDMVNDTFIERYNLLLIDDKTPANFIVWGI